MKRILTITILVIAVLALFFLGYFLFVPKKTLTAENRSVQSEATPELKSFRGVLADILDGIEDATGEITETISNPFAKKEPAATLAPSGGDNNFTFAVLGDTQRFDAGNPQGNFQKAVKSISVMNPALVFSTGDLTSSCENYTECVEKHAEWKKIDTPLLSKTYAAMGNHDNVKNKGVKAWQDVFNFPTNGPADYKEMAYSFDFGDSHFVFLASDSPDEHQVDGEQRTWLDQDLAINKKGNIFVVFHEPAYPVSSKIGESLDTQASDRDALWQILKKYNVTAVFNGHEHIVSRRKIGDIYQFVFGNTDSFNHDLPKPGVAEYASQVQGSFGFIKVNGKEITVETHGPDGKNLDTFTFSK